MRDGTNAGAISLDRKDVKMTKLERIARDLAAVLSDRGEADWHRYLPLAGEVSKRLDRQFGSIMDQRADARIAVQCLARDASIASLTHPRNKEI